MYPRCKRCDATNVETFEWFSTVASPYHLQHVCQRCFDELADFYAKRVLHWGERA